MKKIAIIGSGISGLGAAYLLHKKYDITIFEKNKQMGGHSRTVFVDTPDGNVPVDTGFIVLNDRNYPNLNGLFKALGVKTAKSDMSFGVSVMDGALEYGTRQAWGLFAQPSNLVKPHYWGMLADILRFNKQAKQILADDEDISLGTALDRLKMGDAFRRHYLLPMGGAIWSTPMHKIHDFPAKSFIRFFDNHGLLTVNDHPTWSTVVGGSKVYVDKMCQSIKAHLKPGCAVQKVVRQNDQVMVLDETGAQNMFDEVIMACHSDQALGMIDAPDKAEKEILGNLSYQQNRAVLHRDPRLMPKRKAAWASWVYLSRQSKDDTPAISLSYWMNNLQPLPTDTQIFVTLNPCFEPDSDLIYDEYVFEHPVFDQGAIKAQHKMPTIQGTHKIWYVGAYQRYGFHEDGLRSAVNLADKFGVQIPWS